MSSLPSLSRTARRILTVLCPIVAGVGAVIKSAYHIPDRFLAAALGEEAESSGSGGGARGQSLWAPAGPSSSAPPSGPPSPGPPSSLDSSGPVVHAGASHYEAGATPILAFINFKSGGRWGTSVARWLSAALSGKQARAPLKQNRPYFAAPAVATGRAGKIKSRDISTREWRYPRPSGRMDLQGHQS